jgi:hypothetical protein
MTRLALLLCGVIITFAPSPLAAASPIGVAGVNRLIIDAPLEQSGKCDDNYSGCVPVDSDVDCEGGNGNGPSYVSGPINVTGTDIYELDRDGNGVACES